MITGANQGLGFETARQLVAVGHTVYIGSRNAERGRAAAQRLGARTVVLDVTDDASVAVAAAAIEADGGLDVLTNNAGIEGRTPDNIIIPPADTTPENMRAVFETNVSNPASKAAVNVMTIQFAKAFPSMRITGIFVSARGPIPW